MYALYSFNKHVLIDDETLIGIYDTLKDVESEVQSLMDNEYVNKDEIGFFWKVV